MAPLDADKGALLREIVDQLRAVHRVAAVALGGSYARGTAQPDSDLDLGLYYREATPFAITTIRELAGRLNDTPDPVVTDFYGWGRWVNGGSWLTIRGQRVDLTPDRWLAQALADAHGFLGHHALGGRLVRGDLPGGAQGDLVVRFGGGPQALTLSATPGYTRASRSSADRRPDASRTPRAGT